jgi:hypothetical protein
MSLYPRVHEMSVHVTSDPESHHDVLFRVRSLPRSASHSQSQSHLFVAGSCESTAAGMMWAILWVPRLSFRLPWR